MVVGSVILRLSVPSIFISYRRDDTAAYAGRLYDRLVAEFGTDNVVMDIEVVEPGVDFRDHIRKLVAASNIMLVLIGPQWAYAADHSGKRHLDTPGDFVRLEIATALKNDVRVVPVLVRGADIPPVDSLPDDIRALARRHAIELNDHGWAQDVGRLIDAIQSLTAYRPGKAPKPIQESVSRSWVTPQRASRQKAFTPDTSSDSSTQVRGDADGDPRDIFISYAEEDSVTASHLARELRTHHQSTWTYEEDGIGGVSHLTQVLEVIDSCRAVVLIASKHSVNARNVIKEIEAAHGGDKMLIPVRLGMTHQELVAANPILRMAIGTAVTLSLDPDNIAATAKRIARAMQRAR
jgi:hypothetical protein